MASAVVKGATSIGIPTIAVYEMMSLSRNDRCYDRAPFSALVGPTTSAVRLACSVTAAHSVLTLQAH